MFRDANRDIKNLVQHLHPPPHHCEMVAHLQHDFELCSHIVLKYYLKIWLSGSVTTMFAW